MREGTGGWRRTRPRWPGSRSRRRPVRDCSGIESTADALMYLAIMLLASAAVFALFPPRGAADPAISQEALMDMARWTALALVRTDLGWNGTVGDALSEGVVDSRAVSDAMRMLVPDGYGWNATLSFDGATTSLGQAPRGSVGSHELALGEARLDVRVFRL